MKKIILFFVFFLIIILQVLPHHSQYLEGLNKPGSITVDRQHLYVVDGAKILVYSLDNFSLLRTFGKRGNGPGELTATPYWSNQISLQGDSLFVEGLMKFILIEKNGRLISEKRKTRRYFKMLPIGKNYVAKTFPRPAQPRGYYEAVVIVDPELKDLKELARTRSLMFALDNPFPLVPDSVNFWVYKDKIYLEDSRHGFLIRVFDSRGNSLYEIRREYPRIKVNGEILARELEYMKESFSQKRLSVTVPVHIGERGWEGFKKWAKITEPEYLPIIRDILVKEGRIYVQTYHKVKDKEEYLILDLKGNLIKKVFLPQLKSFALYDSLMLGGGIKYYDFLGNSFFYLEEDEEEEKWMVRVVQF